MAMTPAMKDSDSPLPFLSLPMSLLKYKKAPDRIRCLNDMTESIGSKIEKVGYQSIEILSSLCRFFFFLYVFLFFILSVTPVHPLYDRISSLSSSPEPH